MFGGLILSQAYIGVKDFSLLSGTKLTAWTLWLGFDQDFEPW
ncbi:uncharacterized protein METZ01_LOCUS1922 [marine metagenome]|uniref:Uncharacterized protein n=1 Tax=marine metagenome TaxID=408172 RepID=A0A381N5Z9_9ZZZZ